MSDLIGQTLGQYRIVERIGRGGMASVYKAFQPSLNRYVAIKVLPSCFAHEPGLAIRFTREAKAIARLDHPHILPIYPICLCAHFGVHTILPASVFDLPGLGPSITVAGNLHYAQPAERPLDHFYGRNPSFRLPVCPQRVTLPTR